MQPFDFSSVHDDKSAVTVQARAKDSRYLAGGTNLVDLMKLHVETPAQLVDITPLGWKSVVDKGGTVQIGALMTNSDLAQNAVIKRHFPVLSQAILAGASVQLRNLATTGGNLLQRTRCPYFRDTACACNKREPGSGCSAMDGVNRNLAILGVSKNCIASNPSDMNVALAALGAVIHVKAAQGERKIAISDFYRLPGDTPQIETSLKQEELITAIEINKSSLFSKSVYVKVRDRASYAFALTSAAVALELKNGVVIDSRIALGGVGTIPWRAREAEDALRGKKLDLTLMENAAKTALSNAEPRQGNKFKVDLAQRTLVSALIKCGGLA